MQLNVNQLLILKKVISMIIPNRSITYQKYQDGDISEAEYKTYLTEQEERERRTSERFNETVRRFKRKDKNEKNSKI